jgi:hypothetical protein
MLLDTNRVDMTVEHERTSAAFSFEFADDTHSPGFRFVRRHFKR